MDTAEQLKQAAVDMAKARATIKAAVTKAVDAVELTRRAERAESDQTREQSPSYIRGSGAS